MLALLRALMTVALRSVEHFVIGGAVFGAIVGLVVAYVLIARVQRTVSQGRRPVWLVRLAIACCVVWGWALPSLLGASGAVWGLGHGLGNMIEGPVATAVGTTGHQWLTQASAARDRLLARWPLAKRLNEIELTGISETTPRWLADMLFPNDAPAPWLKEAGISISPALAAVMREALRDAPEKHPTWFQPVIAHLRLRARGESAQRPTVQEALETMISPAAFASAGRTIRATSYFYVKRWVGLALALVVVLAGALLLLGRQFGSARAPDAGAPAAV